MSNRISEQVSKWFRESEKICLRSSVPTSEVHLGLQRDDRDPDLRRDLPDLAEHGHGDASRAGRGRAVAEEGAGEDHWYRRSVGLAQIDARA